jgi:DNA (cytosine-5)-methyltransferase 1
VVFDSQEIGMTFRLLDTFCGAGGCTCGYQRAGFFVVGIDNRPQPHYCGDGFVLADALESMRTLLDGGCITDNLGCNWYLSDFDAIHASPTCQRYSEETPVERRDLHPDYIPELRDLLKQTRKPYVIENVEGARGKLLNPLMLCGTMFGMKLYRHRYFELSWSSPILSPMCCQHYPNPVLWTGMGGGTSKGRKPRQTMEHKRSQGGIDWMVGTELTLAIPPAYTFFIGTQLMQYLSRSVPA